MQSAKQQYVEIWEARQASAGGDWCQSELNN